MQGRFVTLINLTFFALGAVILFLSINYFIGAVGTTAALQPSYLDTVKETLNFSDIECPTKKELKEHPEKYEKKIVKEPEFCTYLNVEIAAGAFAVMVGVVQMLVCILAVATKWVNWVIWIIGHVVSFLLSLLAAIIVFAVYIIYPFHMEHVCKKAYTPKNGKLSYAYKDYCEQLYPVYASFATQSNQTLKAVVTYFGVMLLLNSLFCIAGIILMARKRKDTVEGGPGILHARGEELVQKISKKFFEKSSQTHNQPPPEKPSVTSTTTTQPPSLKPSIRAVTKKTPAVKSSSTTSTIRKPHPAKAGTAKPPSLMQ